MSGVWETGLLAAELSGEVAIGVFSRTSSLLQRFASGLTDAKVRNGIGKEKRAIIVKYLIV